MHPRNKNRQAKAITHYDLISKKRDDTKNYVYHPDCIHLGWLMVDNIQHYRAP